MAVNYGSGTRYTRPEQGKLIVENTETYPWFMTSNMRVSYKLKLGKFNGDLFMHITNLFNLQRFRGVNDVNWYHLQQQYLSQFDSNGDGEVTTADENFFGYMSLVDLDHDGETDANKQNPERGINMNPSVYQEKRHFRLGISIGF